MLLPAIPPIRAFVNLPRQLIAVVGQDAPKFLNGIVTNKIGPIDSPSAGVYAGFLNSKGRILADAFIHGADHFDLVPNPHNEPAYIVECDRDVGKDLMRTLKTYKLRAKVKILPLDPDSFNVFSVWDESAATQRSFPLSVTNPLVINPSFSAPILGANDSRASGFGIRLITPSSIKSPHEILTPQYVDIGDLPEASQHQYNIRRYLYGIPEGPLELPPTQSLPLDSCMDYMGGIDFNKGCYVGQELTIRSHHHGIVRKRIIPVVLGPYTDLVYDPHSGISAPLGAEILSATPTESPAKSPTAGISPFTSALPSSRPNRKPRASGSLIASIGNIGLALVRLEHFANPESSFYVSAPENNLSVKGFVPFWWP